MCETIKNAVMDVKEQKYLASFSPEVLGLVKQAYRTGAKDMLHSVLLLLKSRFREHGNKLTVSAVIRELEQGGET